MEKEIKMLKIKTFGSLPAICVSFLALFLPLVHSYPGGAPDQACDSMFPSGHGVESQRSEPPFKIAVEKKVYSPNHSMKVTMITTEGYFKGVYLQAREVGCKVNTTRTVGTFLVHDFELQTRHCFGGIHSAVTHTAATKKRRKTVYWTAPVNPSGHVVMRATFVKDVHVFWTNVESDVLVDLQSMDTPKCLKNTVSPTPEFQQTSTPDSIALENVSGLSISGASLPCWNTKTFVFVHVLCAILQAIKLM